MHASFLPTFVCIDVTIVSPTAITGTVSISNQNFLIVSVSLNINGSLYMDAAKLDIKSGSQLVINGITPFPFFTDLRKVQPYVK